ncbi:transporter [Rhizobium leguminosarum]|uniref:transporter n=1 Tax=Rhizobium leguminosarum TaxID=384 RepID=UPI001C983C4A|nr:transporter [Rhizobium leguminosarum]MBY5541397.1 transporter [Rhizobium leguminosarum]MBY5550996.1 transporter [Rhizobium leguminosarum]MBY5636232.1 transporter [Rhizobium leguminosarum]MBY5699416.1 transporter [Rhizobium leguminosarum]MBY5742704.1 transporter [Rhizobium leguminosarum]
MAQTSSTRTLPLKRSLTLAVAAALGVGAPAYGQDSSSDLAKKLSNPIASLISVPFQMNYDHGYGPLDGDKATLNIQPVIPFSLNADWNLISRTILPVTYQNDIAGPSGSQFGLGDVVQSFFLSPAKPTDGGLIWGAGPVFLIPTATDDLLGGEKWGAGPTIVALKQDGPWTYGVLANHIWSFAGNEDRNDISSTYMQPFLSYTTPTAWTFALNTESTYDWEAHDWSVPINLTVSKLVKVNEQPISLTAGLRYWAAAPDDGPEGLGVRVGLTFLFPK